MSIHRAFIFKDNITVGNGSSRLSDEILKMITVTSNNILIEIRHGEIREQ